MESHYICPFRCRLRLCIKIFTKNALSLKTKKSPLGVSLSLSATPILVSLGGLIWILRRQGSWRRASPSILCRSSPGTSTKVRIFESAYFFTHVGLPSTRIRIKNTPGFKNVRISVDMASGVQIVMITRGGAFPSYGSKEALPTEQGIQFHYFITIIIIIIITTMRLVKAG